MTIYIFIVAEPSIGGYLGAQKGFGPSDTLRAHGIFQLSCVNTVVMRGDTEE